MRIDRTRFPTVRRCIALVVAATCAACPSSGAHAPIDRSSEAKLDCKDDPSRSVNDERPSRAQCLAPPWNLAANATPVFGLAHFACDDKGRSHAFTHEGTRELSPDEQMKFLERHRAAIHAIAGVDSSGFGVCCIDNKGPTGGCVRISVGLCTTRIDAIAKTFVEFLETDGLGDARLNLVVDLSGAPGPRCSSKVAACGPTPYTHITLAQAGYRCDAERKPLSRGKKLAWGKCAHDGECSQAGCGNQCVPWTESSLIGTCEGYLDMEAAPAFCGCVLGECAWFVQ